MRRAAALLLLCLCLGNLLLPVSGAEDKSYTLTFAGDCTLGSNPQTYYAQLGFVKTVGEDYGYPFRNVISWFETDDLTLVNLEGPLTDTGYPMVKRHVFRGPEAFVNILTENSVEGVTLANNHTLDYGKEGYANTKRVLEEAGIPYAEGHGSALVELDGLTVGIYAVSYDSLEESRISGDIAALAEQAELVIFAPHWGYEGSYLPNAQQTRLAHAAIDAGAHIVWGSHPHVLQPVEEYGDGVIFYSMGNFAFGGNPAPEDLDSALIQQQVLVNEDGGVTLGERTVIPVSVSSAAGYNNFQPTPYEEGSPEYNRVLEKLGLENQ